MAQTAAGAFILDDAEFIWNSVDLSDHVRSIEFPLSRDEIEVSAMGDKWRSYLVGRPEVAFTVEFYQDYYTSEVDATLRNDFADSSTGDATSRTCTIMPDKTQTIGTTNPQASMTAYIISYPWLSGDYNAALTASVGFRATGTVTFNTS